MSREKKKAPAATGAQDPNPNERNELMNSLNHTSAIVTENVASEGLQPCVVPGCVGHEAGESPTFEDLMHRMADVELTEFGGLKNVYRLAASANVDLDADGEPRSIGVAIVIEGDVPLEQVPSLVEALREAADRLAALDIEASKITGA
jgi:hypothetical protein